MKLGLERYGHGLQIHDDTRQWGTKENSWAEMALEEAGIDTLQEGEAVSFEIGENKGKENAINIKKV